MRRARITYEGAYHHIMNRGIRGEKIFAGAEKKKYFLKALEEKSRKLKIKILTYCIMDNHYHLVLQNVSGMLSNFMKELNGQYGIYYRRTTKTKGYVFQNRYKSTLVQEDRYLRQVIIYTLVNAVKAGIVKDACEYKWSSVGKYYCKDRGFVDTGEVEAIFGSKDNMIAELSECSKKELEIKNTPIGQIMGDEVFIKKAGRLFDRRKKRETSGRKRSKDYAFIPAEEVIVKFEKNKGVNLKDIDINSLSGKKLRNKLLVLLKDQAGLKYSEIIRMPFFKHLKYNSMGALYMRTKKIMETRENVLL